MKWPNVLFHAHRTVTLQIWPKFSKLAIMVNLVLPRDIRCRWCRWSKNAKLCNKICQI